MATEAEIEGVNTMSFNTTPRTLDLPSLKITILFLELKFSSWARVWVNPRVLEDTGFLDVPEQVCSNNPITLEIAVSEC